MKKILTLLLLVAGTFLTTAQYVVTIDASILDQDTNQPIPYANVGFVDLAVGTVSDQNGRIFLEYEEGVVNNDAVLRISMLGYETRQFTIAELFDELSKSNKIFLKPNAIELEEAKVIAEKRRKTMLNRPRGVFSFIGYWKDKKGLGGEIATLIKVRHENVKLRNLNFAVKENESDSLLVRINIYEEKNRKPGKKLIAENIYHTVKQGHESIDLKPYDIIVNDDFIIGIELVEVYGDAIGFAVMGSSKGRSYLRDVSQAKWKKFNSTGMAFLVEASYPDDGKYKARKKPKNITLYWDTSLIMNDRDLAKELTFLKQYISGLGSGNIHFIPFSNSLKKKEVFAFKNGQAPDLIKTIRQQKYNGATNFNPLFATDPDTDTYLVFSDGKATYGVHTFPYNVPVFFVNSKKDANRKIMQEVSEKSGGYLLDLYTYDVGLALQQIYKDVGDLRNFSEVVPGYITGMVQSKSGQPIQGCKVTVDGTLAQTVTNLEGRFAIKADPGQTINFEYLGMVSQKHEVNNTNDQPTIKFKSDIAVLDEVNLNTRKDTIANEIIDILGHKVRRRSAGNALYTLKNEKFPKAAIYLSDVIRSRFPGVQVIGFGDDARYIVRGVSSFVNQAGPMFIVDGAQFFTPPIFLQPAMIESISLIPGLSGTARFGDAGRGGVFIITTKTAPKTISPEKENSLLVRGNNYNERVKPIDPNYKRPAYLDQLWQSNSPEEALNTYTEMAKLYDQNIPFYIYASEYFNRWNKNTGNEVLSSIAEIANDNAQALRALAFKLESGQRHQEALEVYERIFQIEYKYNAQIYLDLARSYLKNERFPEALRMYKVILRNKTEGLDFTALLEQAESHLQRFSNLYRFQIPREEMPRPFLTVKSPPVRVVFDWNDPQTEFEVQFVTPQKKYFTWSRKYQQDPEDMNNQLKNGILSKQFTVDHTFPGEWIINLKSLQKEISAENPVFLKYSIYTNYGLPNEEEEVRFIKLYNQTTKVTLDRFKVPIDSRIGVN